MRWAIEHRWVTVGVGLAALVVSLFLAFSGIIGAEFLPHLDEGAIWARGTLANSTSLTEGDSFHHQARAIFRFLPGSDHGRVGSRAGPTTEPTPGDSATPNISWT